MKKFKDSGQPREQLMLLPPSINDFVPNDAPARYIANIIGQMDLSGVYASYPGGGAPAYEPRTLLQLLLFSYSDGERSSRRIAQKCKRDTHYMYLCEMQTPGHNTIARFRRRHEKLIIETFLFTVHQCQKEGLVLLEQVAVDGTKLEANVSGKATMSVKRAEIVREKAAATIKRIMAEAEEIDAAEDRAESERDRQKEVQAIERLKKSQEQAEAAIDMMEERKVNSICITDTESRVMRTGRGNRPGYNAQAAVDGANQVIVAASITQDLNDMHQLPEMVKQIQANTGETPEHVTADAGYSSIETLVSMEENGIDAYVALRPCEQVRADLKYDEENDILTKVEPETGLETQFRFLGLRKQKERRYRLYRCLTSTKTLSIRDSVEKDIGLRLRMMTKLNSKRGRKIYRLRQQTVEPVFGRLKTTLGLTRFLLRGKSGANIEYLLCCAAHNLKKLLIASQMTKLNPA